jgi:DNA-binding NtrC family response regulator
MPLEKPLTRTLDDLLAAYERVVIMETLKRNRWNRRLAAEALRISERRLYCRLEVLHFDLAAIPHDSSGRRRRSAPAGV